MNVMMVLRAGLLHLDRDRVKLAMPHSRLRHHGLRKMHHGFRRPAQNHRLDTIVVIEMGMHCRNRHVVMIVLHAGQPAGELPLVVVVNVAQSADTMFCRAIAQLCLA